MSSESNRRGGDRREGGYSGGSGRRPAGNEDRSRGGRGRPGRWDQESAREERSARVDAARQLHRIDTDEAYVGLIRREGGDAYHDRRLTDYVAGVTRWRRWLDFVISSHYRGDFYDMESLLRQVLRVGAYELLLTRTPPHAAIHEAVETAKEVVREGAGGLVNGVLRAVQRTQPEPNGDDPADNLAIRYSHPTWMVRRWLERFGEDDTRRLLTYNNERPAYGMRIVGPVAARPAFHDLMREARIQYEASPYLDDFLRVHQLQAVIRAKWIERGYCTVQDESAGLVVRLLDPKSGEHLVDACSAPGGKTLYASTRMGPRGRITALDLSKTRLGMVTEAAKRAVAPIETKGVDFRTWAETATASADRVLVDAPCSGAGVLARRADLRWNRDETDLAGLIKLQDELLDAAAIVVRPGGVVVYATCTIFPEENEARVAAFLERHPDFAVESAKGLVPEQMVTEEGFYASLPQRDGIDGAFGVRLRRARATSPSDNSPSAE